MGPWGRPGVGPEGGGGSLSESPRSIWICAGGENETRPPPIKKENLTTSKPQNPKNFQKPVLSVLHCLFPAQAGRQNWVLPLLKNLIRTLGCWMRRGRGQGSRTVSSPRRGGQVLDWKLALGPWSCIVCEVCVYVCVPRLVLFCYCYCFKCMAGTGSAG